MFFFCEASFSLLLAGGGISLLLLPGGILQLMAVIKDSRCSLQQTLLIQNKKRNARCIWSMQNSSGSGGVYEHKRALIAALVYKTWIYVVVFLGKITSSSPRFKGDTTTNQLINHQSIKQELWPVLLIHAADNLFFLRACSISAQHSRKNCLTLHSKLSTGI